MRPVPLPCTPETRCPGCVALALWPHHGPITEYAAGRATAYHAAYGHVPDGSPYSREAAGLAARAELESLTTTSEGDDR